MLRVVVTYLLLLAILACPFNCLGIFNCNPISEALPTPKCHCCVHACDAPQPKPSNNEQDNSTDQRDDECRCPSCVCEGAIVAPKVILSDASVAGISAQHLRLHFLAFPEHEVAQSIRLASRLNPPQSFLSGRAARILFRSFLI